MQIVNQRERGGDISSSHNRIDGDREGREERLELTQAYYRKTTPERYVL